MDKIKQLIYEGNADEAIRLLDEYLAGHKPTDEAYYLKGNAYRKKGETRLAMNCYLQAMELNPESPAHQAYQMLVDILNFYNKDMYNH